MPQRAKSHFAITARHGCDGSVRLWILTLPSQDFKSRAFVWNMAKPLPQWVDVESSLSSPLL